MQPWQSRFCEQLLRYPRNSLQIPAAELLFDVAEDFHHDFVNRYAGLQVCADPVSLCAGRDSASLVPAELLELSSEEADSLIASINDFLAQDALCLKRTDAEHWFLFGCDGRELDACPPMFLAQRQVSAFLPEGPHIAQWQRLSTEIQMLLHSHPVNEAREQRGALPINSLWFWGGAALPDKSQPASAAPGWRVFADEPFAQALCRHLDMQCSALQDYDPTVGDGSVLIVDTRMQQAMLARDESAVIAARQRMLQDWPRAWQQGLDQGVPLSLEILDDDGYAARLLSQAEGVDHDASVAAVQSQSPQGWFARLRRRLSKSARGSR